MLGRAFASRRRTLRQPRLLLVGLSVLLPGCAEVELDAPRGSDSSPSGAEVNESPESLPIIGGVASQECAFPSTVRLSGASLCTGTLIHPRVVISAAHCISKNGTSGQVTVGFGEKNAPGAFNVTAQCKSGARGGSGGSTGRDWAYCILPEDARVARQPITPPLAACEASRFLKVGAKAVAVGYGVTSPNGNTPSPKRQVEIAVQRVEAGGVIIAGDRAVGACYGDSGGPLYMRLVGDDGRDFGWRVIGSTSGPDAKVRNCRCNCGTSFVNVAQHVTAIEAQERIDVTPCTDASGKWSPGPGCARLPSDLFKSLGKFPSCDVPLTTQPIESCGPSAAAEAVIGGVIDTGFSLPRDTGTADAGT